MTLAAAFWPRRFPGLPPASPRLFQIEPGTCLRADCHWQRARHDHPAIVLVHGLEGSSNSNYIRGTAEKAWQAGFHVVRINQRNCGGTERLTGTLYNSGLSGDYRHVVTQLLAEDGIREVFAAGFSMGGNLILKMAAEFGPSPPPGLRAVAAVCPALDLAACADEIGSPRNRIYSRHFVTSLRRHMRLKSRLFPALYPLTALNGLDRVRTVREFDNTITARFCGFRDADDYYARSSARALIGQIAVPSLVLTSQDDPLVPFRTFADPAITDNPVVTFLAPRFGGHCAFISRDRGARRFWAEMQVVTFCLQNSTG